MKRDPNRKLDPETMLALAKARTRQDRRAVSYLIAAAIMLLILGVVWWLLWPEDPPRFNLAAYDSVAVSDETIPLSARLEPEGTTRSNNLEGLDLRYQIKETQTDETRATDTGGRAVLDWQPPKGKSTVVEFMVRHQHKENPKNVVRDQGRVFIWPTDAKLLVVDVDHALTEGVDGLAANTAPTLRPGATATLRVLAPKYKIVYLSAGAGEPGRYKKLRSWLPQMVPAGPLLGPPAGGVDKLFIGHIEELKKRFSQPALCVTGRATEAQMALDAGWKAVVIGDAKDLPAGATSIAGWTDFPKQ
jgi:hypothetical protein